MIVELAPEMAVREADRIANEVHRRVHDEALPGYCFVQVAPEPTQRDAALSLAQ
ncbi:MAG: hypothetical protein IPP91_10325 [Betaproteobacteria bacterium]|nr:hypothetical protein [Betaproteobacteria bacterium]